MSQFFTQKFKVFTKFSLIFDEKYFSCKLFWTGFVDADSSKIDQIETQTEKGKKCPKIEAILKSWLKCVKF